MGGGEPEREAGLDSKGKHKQMKQKNRKESEAKL